jgi:hypothetical protein
MQAKLNEVVESLGTGKFDLGEATVSVAEVIRYALTSLPPLPIHIHILIHIHTHTQTLY